MNDCGQRQTAREIEAKEDETWKMEEPSSELYVELTCLRVQCNQETTIAGAHFGRAGQGPKNGPA
jgi:hypothetical protein